MGTMVENIGRDVGKAMNLFALPAQVAEAGVRKLEGQPFLSTVRHHGVDALWNAVALPPRLAWDMIKGMARGTLHLTWSAIKLLPLPIPTLDSWKKERGDVAMRTKDALDLFRFDIDSKFALPPMGAAAQKQDSTPTVLAA